MKRTRNDYARRSARQVRPVLITFELPDDFETSRFGRRILEKNERRTRGEIEGRKILINYLILARVRANYWSLKVLTRV